MSGMGSEHEYLGFLHRRLQQPKLWILGASALIYHHVRIQLHCDIATIECLMRIYSKANELCESKTGEFQT